MQQQWELLVTDGHAWASRWRRVMPFLFIGAIASGATGFWLLYTAPHVEIAEATATANTRQLTTAWNEWVDSGNPSEALPGDSLPPFSEIPQLEKTIRADLNNNGKIESVTAQSVAIADLFKPETGLRWATVGNDIAVITALCSERGYIVRWIAVARRFGKEWSLATMQSNAGAGTTPERIPETTKTILDAAGKGAK
jgi:hypothetical protein